MNKLATQLNDTLGAAADFLSAAGKRMYFPYGGILGQGAEAKSCEINATIGMAFEEDGSPLVMDCFKKGLNLDKKAFLYAGSFGIPKLREQWKEMEEVKQWSSLYSVFASKTPSPLSPYSENELVVEEIDASKWMSCFEKV